MIAAIQERRTGIIAKTGTKHVLSGSATTIVLIWFVFSFFPYPAIPMGNTSCIQFSQLLFPFLLIHSGNRRIIFHNPGLYTILCCNGVFFVSAAMNYLLGPDFLPVFALKGVALFNAYLLQLLGGILLSRCRLHSVLCALLVAVGAHFVCGLVQFISFRSGEFPFLELYNHNGYTDPRFYADAYAQYVQRPMGLFPEPSAMAACLGPWLGWMFAIAFFRDPAVPSLRYNVLATIIFTMGLCLLILSGSGYLLVFAVGLFMYSLTNMKRVPIAFGSLLPLLALAIVFWPDETAGTLFSFVDNIHGQSGVYLSWDERLSSMLFAADTYLRGGSRTILFGIGPFNSATYMLDVGGFLSVCSVIGGLFLENGLLGLCGIVFVARQVFRAIIASENRNGLFLMASLLFAGTVIVTSYYSLAPLWTALGFCLGGGAVLDKPTHYDGTRNLAVSHVNSPTASNVETSV